MKISMRAVCRLMAVLLLWSSASAAAGHAMSDAAVRAQMIRESIANYPGNCPCPYKLGAKRQSVRRSQRL